MEDKTKDNIKSLLENEKRCLVITRKKIISELEEGVSLIDLRDLFNEGIDCENTVLTYSALLMMAKDGEV